MTIQELFVTPDSELISGAEFSDCCAYRYRLWRIWEPDLPRLVWIMLNPSTADAEMNDPTIRRCIGFAKREGCGGIEVVNLYALRSTDPSALGKHPDPVGPENLAYLDQAMESGSDLVAAWGAWTGPARMHSVARSLLPDAELLCLGRTKKDRAPRHPLYVRADQPFEVWS